MKYRVPALACGLALLLQPAFAQDGPAPLKLPPPMPRPGIPKLRAGPVPPPLVAPSGLAKKKKKKKKKDAKKAADDTKRAKPFGKARGRKDGPKPSLRKPPPGAGAKAGGKVPGWRQKEADAEPKAPTLSADFIKNCNRLRPGVKVHLDIYEEELDAVVKLIACMTGKNIVLSKSLKGKKITIYSPQMVTAKEAYRVFLTALEQNSYTISRQGKFLRIIDIKDAPRTPDPLLPEGATPPAEDRMVTQLVRLENVDAAEILEVINKLATANAQFIVYAPDNALIITETGSNLRKLRRIMDQLDVPGGAERLWIYEVVHAEAADIAQKIQEIFEKEATTKGSKKPKRSSSKSKRDKRKGKGSPSSSAVGQSELDVHASKVLADERTNRLFIVASKRSYRQIKRLIRKLDVAIPGDGQVHIHQLNHAKATDLASVLSSLAQEQRGRGGAKARRPSASKSKAKKSKASGAASSAALFEGELNVVADEDTNTLVITASLKDYLSLKKVIDQLDRPRRQVFIEALVMEVSVDNTREFGINAHGGDPNFTDIGGSNVPLLVKSTPTDAAGSIPTSAVGLTGLAVAAFTEETVPFGGVDIPAFGVVIRAIASSNDVNVLSAPHILTTDNEEAEISVGNRVPFPRSSGGLGGLAGLAGQQGGNNNLLGGLGALAGNLGVTYEEVALTLTITPRINAANFVTLEIQQELEEIDRIDPETQTPTTSKRSVKTTVVVKDQHTVVIGGLQKNRTNKGRSGVPILGEIPVIGYFFRETRSQRERRNLLLLLTPHVVEGPEDFKAIYDRKMDEHREFVERFQRRDGRITLGLDYGKKHGVIEAMHKSIEVVRDEQAVLEELRRSQERPPLPQDLDGVPLDDPPPPSDDPEPEPEPAGAPEAALPVDPPEPPPVPAEEDRP